MTTKDLWKLSYSKARYCRRLGHLHWWLNESMKRYGYHHAAAYFLLVNSADYDDIPF